jgi:hypothetical protein
MSQTAARPWWADVQHLRPDEDGGDQRAPRTGRFDRASASPRRSATDHRPARPAARERRPEAHAPRRRERPEPENWLEASEAAVTPTTTTPDAAPATEQAAPKPERRTIQIRGQVDRVAGVAPVPSPGPQRHRGRMPHERVGPRPDRVALWAVLLGLLLILVAAISSPGADAAAIFIAL